MGKGDETRSAILEATYRLVQDRGYQGTSLSDILEASGAPRGSIYYHFPGGKDQIILEAVRLGVDEVSELIRAVAAHTSDPADIVRLSFRGTADWIRDFDYGVGCPVAPVILDGVAPDSPLHDLCADALSEWEGLYADAFVAGGIGKARARELATVVVVGLEGGLIMARSRRDTAPLTLAGEELARTVAAATAPA